MHSPSRGCAARTAKPSRLSEPKRTLGETGLDGKVVFRQLTLRDLGMDDLVVTSRNAVPYAGMVASHRRGTVGAVTATRAGRSPA